MDTYEQTLIKKIEALKNAKTPLQRSRRNALLKLLGELQNQDKRNEEA